MELNYKTFGQGHPLIILHGLFGSLDNWQTLARQWANHFTVFIVDQRNHGRSPQRDEITYPLMAEDLRQFMEAHWMYHAHILGHSMGGKTAMTFAGQYPDMVDKLVVVDIAPKVYQGGHENIFDALLSVDLPSATDRKLVEEQLAARIHEPAVLQFLLKNLSRQPNGNLGWKMNLPAIYRHYADILADIPAGEPCDKPTLFIKGGNSAYIRPTDWPAIEERFPAAQLATIEGAGHWVHADQPAALRQLVLDFLLED